MKLTINSKGFKDAKILLDDKDISPRVVKTVVDIEGGCVPVVTLKLHPDDIEIDGEFEVLRKIPKEKCNNHGTELVINGAIVAKDVDSEDLAKAIMENFNKSSYR